VNIFADRHRQRSQGRRGREQGTVLRSRSSNYQSHAPEKCRRLPKQRRPQLTTRTRPSNSFLTQ
jgi:hypothetical protein